VKGHTIKTLESKQLSQLLNSQARKFLVDAVVWIV
jgi:hypothetical protein